MIKRQGSAEFLSGIQIPLTLFDRLIESDAQCQKGSAILAEREGFEPSVPVTQYARFATPRRFANGFTSARLFKTISTTARWFGSATAIPPSLTESH
jgi:hypothetical protein